MNKEKEKINWKFAFAVAIPVSIVASIILSIIFLKIEDKDSRKRENLEKIYTNEYLIQYFGENNSITKVKSLIDEIEARNLIAEHDTGGLGYVYVILNGKICNTEEVLGLIKKGKRYRVNTPNDDAINERTFINDNEFILENSQSGAAYYYNGYLRAISIEEVMNENQ